MRRPYHRTLWTFVQLQEIERIEDLKERGRQLNVAGLLAIAFHEPKKLQDEHHRLLTDLGMLPTSDEAIDRASGVIEAMAAISSGALATTTEDPNATQRAAEDDA